MANRKVLINRHTSTSGAPIATEMFKGEIAVAHETGKETLWTKNNDNVMVPFISCAQTISIIDSKIQTSEDDVKTASGETHLEVATADTAGAKVWTLSTKDVQSENEFKAYSARTNNALTALTKSFADLLDIALTAGTGDDIITVETASTDTSANTFTVTHKTATAVTGFNKLNTDDYGHVTAATPVAASDIKALGFEDSAWTEEAITNAIAELDSAIAATDGKYITGIAIADGKISGFTEADLPTLTSAKTGTGNVVSDIAVNGHEISFTTTSVATSEDIQKLSAATMSLSGVVGDFSGATDTKLSELSAYTENVDNKVITLSSATVAEFSSAFTAINNLSADTVAYVNAVSGNIESVINAMDKAASAEDGKVVTTVSEVDGVVSETKANVKDLQLGGYVKDTTATGDIASADTINAALSKLENKAAAITIANADGSINVTTGSTGTDINVNIKSGEHVLAKDGNAGLYTDLDLVKITTGLPATVKERYQLLATDDSQIGVDIDIAKDSHIVSITFISDTADTHYQNLEYKYIDVNGNEQTEYVDVSSLVLEAEFASGVTVTNHVAHGVVDPTSESFLTVGADGFKVSGVQAAIDAKVNALDVTDDAAVAGQYVAAIEETDGVVAVKARANVSEAVLNNYAKGTDDSAVAATDTVNGAISKLENQIDKAKAAATTKVVEGTDTGNNMTITPTTSATDGSVTYTVDLTDVASKAALDAEIAARKAVDGQNGDTYAANTNTNFISDATSLNDADVKLDAAIKALSGNAHDAMIARDNAVFSSAKTYTDDQIDEVYASGVSYTDAKVAAEIALLDSSTAVTTGKYITGIAIADGKISGITEESLPANVVITATTATPVDTASAVLTGVTASGTDNHNLTFGMSNKVFSAASADEAAKVAHALSVSGYSDSSASTLDTAFAYDGSNAKSLTFGTNGPAGLKSMSMTSAGLVDVEVIDCGEY